jgi:Na+-transporting NADH:ubiquinone oxidoreductase subunit D
MGRDAMSAEANKRSLGRIAATGLWGDNPVFSQILGICSTLAVTNMVLNTLVMCAALVATLALSSLTISWLRAWTPRNIRMMVETLIIAFYVIVVDVLLKAYWPDMSENLGPYVGLIITNCIVMGRAEACAISQPPMTAMMDGFFNGLGYSWVLLLIAIPREVMGLGTVMGIPAPFFSGPYWDKWTIMVMPPGAFFMLAILVWVFRSRQVEKKG